MARSGPSGPTKNNSREFNSWVVSLQRRYSEQWPEMQGQIAACFGSVVPDAVRAPPMAGKGNP